MSSTARVTPASSTVYGAPSPPASGRCIASWLPRTKVQPVAEHAVRGEEGRELVLGAAVREIALHDDDVGIERLHLVDDRAVHRLGVRRVAGRGAEERADVLVGRAEVAALGLAEVHVVRGGDRGEQAPGGRGRVRNRAGSSSLVGSTPSTASAYSVPARARDPDDVARADRRRPRDRRPR